MCAFAEITFAQCVYDLFGQLKSMLRLKIGSPFIPSVCKSGNEYCEEQPSECGASYGCPTSTGNDNFNYTVWRELMRAKFVDVQCPTYAPCNYT